MKKPVLIFFASLFEAHSRMIDHPMTTQEFYPVLVPLDQGILPEHPVRQSIDEVIMNHDAVLEYTLQLIKQNNAI